VKGRDMSKLFNLKERLTISESAQYLSATLSETVTEADVLQLALSEKLKISVYFPVATRSEGGNLFDDFDYPSGNLIGSDRLPSENSVHLRDKWFVAPIYMCGTILGTFDLPMLANERLLVENAYRKSIGETAIDLSSDECFMVEGLNDDFFQINPFKFIHKRKGESGYGIFGHDPIPDNISLVIKSKALRDFLDGLPSQDQTTKQGQDKPLNTRERNTLLTIIGAFCKYESIKSQERGTARKIMEMTDDLGAHVDEGTIKDVLAKIPNALETRMK
jgi:hypothetical protein